MIVIDGTDPRLSDEEIHAMSIMWEQVMGEAPCGEEFWEKMQTPKDYQLEMDRLRAAIEEVDVNILTGGNEIEWVDRITQGRG
tara:strand:+ start:581 stop:829 length:249 start_codon:yes stop_codon:yes gene_type:complete